MSYESSSNIGGLLVATGSTAIAAFTAAYLYHTQLQALLENFQPKQNSSEFDKFVGEWDLVSLLAIKDGKTKYPFGRKPVGRLIYTSNGYMFKHIAKQKRSRLSTPSISEAPDAEKAVAFEETVSYTGSFEVNERNRTVKHNVVSSTDPVMVECMRGYSFSNQNENLSLSITYKGGLKIELLWKRL